MYGVVLDDAVGMDAAEFAARLAEKGVQTRPFFLGMHEQPAFREAWAVRGRALPGGRAPRAQGLYLPSGLALTDEQLAQTVAAVTEVLGR